MSMTKQLEKLAARIYRTPSPPMIFGQKYAFIYAITNAGKHIFDGPYPVAVGQDQPPIEAESFLSGFPNGEIFILKTKDKKKAKQEVKHMLAARGEDPDEALKRMFKKPEEKFEPKKRRKH